MCDQTEYNIDLYALSMLFSWHCDNKHNDYSVMECFCRKLPNNRKFLLNVGIGRVIDYLQNLKFTDESIDFLCSKLNTKLSTDNFKTYLKNVNFAKEIKIFAPEEGDIIFANEPIIQLYGPIGLLEYVEKNILSILNSDIKRASKYARVVIAARGKPLIEMGGRREHESITVDAARSAYIAGFEATSCVQADWKYSIPCRGTQAHVYTMSYDSELMAFTKWAQVYESSTYLIDTYDVYEGLENALKADPNLGAVRLDSGDLYGQSINIKRRLNKGDNCNTKIIATNDLNEYKIATLEEKGAPIDIYGVGTEGIIVPDSPSLGIVYKLVDINGNPVCKLSADTAKSTFPGIHQVWRYYAITKNGQYMMTHDVIGLKSALVQESDICRPLLKEHPLDITYDKKEVVQKAREKFTQVLTEMPEYLKLIPTDPKNEQPVTYHIEISNQLAKLKQELITKYKTSSA